MAIKRTYVVRGGKLVEVTVLKKREKLYPADKKETRRRDAIAAIPEAEHIAYEEIGKIKRGERSM